MQLESLLDTSGISSSNQHDVSGGEASSVEGFARGQREAQEGQESSNFAVMVGGQGQCICILSL